jgi:cytochrome c oxidase subunit IV
MKAHEHQHEVGGEHVHGQDDHHDIASHVKVYMYVFYALIVGTIITVAVSYVDLGERLNLMVGLFIASCKALLVAGYFMHLISEKKMIYGLLVVTVFFFASLMYLTLWSMQPENLVHIRHVS